MKHRLDVEEYKANLLEQQRTIDDFTDRFDPIFDEDGSDLQEQIPVGADLHFWWTVVEQDFGQVLNAGFHCVGVLGFVQCRVPWSEPHDHWFEYRTFPPEEEE